MKKILIAVLLFMATYYNVHAYNFTAKDEVIVDKVTETIKDYISQGKLNKAKVITQLEKVAERKRGTRTWFLIAWILANFDTLTQSELERLITWPSFDINDYLWNVLGILCESNEGEYTLWSAFAMSFWNKSYRWIFTNRHVVDNSVACAVFDKDNKYLFMLDLEEAFNYNDRADFNFFYLRTSDQELITEANYLSGLLTCGTSEIWQKVWIIWYPKYWIDRSWSWNKRYNLITTQWIISWFRDEEISDSQYKYNYSNYYVTNRIDWWNSWWLALREHKDDWFCILGIPTWLSIWDYENQWVVQNISNVIDTTEVR